MDSISGASSEGDSGSNASCYGHIAAEHFQLVYRNDELVWGGSGNSGEIRSRIKGQDIIVVVRSTTGFTILSLPPNSSSTAAPHPAILQTLATNLPQSFLAKYIAPQLPTHLGLPPEDIYVVISTKSGAGNAGVYFESIIKPALELVGLDEKRYQIIRTESYESIGQFAKGDLDAKAREGIKQTVLLLSGDGGVVDIVNGLLGNGPISSRYTRPTICLFPRGTANALFHSLHLRNPPQTIPPSDLITALRTLLNGNPQRLPSFCATFSPSSRLLSNEGRTARPISSNRLFGSIVVSYGLHATLVANSDTEEWRKHGAARFGMVAKELLSPADGGEPHAYRAKVILRKCSAPAAGGLIFPRPEFEEIIPREDHGYILMTLVSNLEKTFCISPASNPLDGKLWIVHFGPKSGEEVMRIMGRAYQGGQHISNGSEGDEVVGYEEAEGARIEFLEPGDEQGRWRRVCVDGLIVRVEEGGWMEVTKVEEGGEAVDILVV